MFILVRLCPRLAWRFTLKTTNSIWSTAVHHLDSEWNQIESEVQINLAPNALRTSHRTRIRFLLSDRLIWLIWSWLWTRENRENMYRSAGERPIGGRSTQRASWCADKKDNALKRRILDVGACAMSNELVGPGQFECGAFSVSVCVWQVRLMNRSMVPPNDNYQIVMASRRTWHLFGH